MEDEPELRTRPEKEPPRHAVLPGPRSRPLAVKSDEAPDARPVGRLRRTARWLFAQASAPQAARQVAEPQAASEVREPPAASEVAEPDASEVPDVDAGRPPSTAPPVVEVQPAGPRPRPRPYAGAPLRTDEPSTDEPSAAPDRVTPAIATGEHQPGEDAPPTAGKRASPGGAPKGRRVLRRFVRTGIVLTVLVLAAALLRVYVVAPYFIPSASMEPTLHGCSGCNNDHVLVDKLSYRMHDIHRGDVVVFHRPLTWAVPDKTLIKRVVGLPGDKIRVTGGKLFVNGLMLQESYTNSACPPGSSGTGTLAGGKTYGPVPLGDVFVMGDNRCDSSDSRMFGPVPDSTVIGRAFVIIWPLGRIHFL
ncbi:MAG: signal peptidase I [Jatrophihabitantaceae bacterium]